MTSEIRNQNNPIYDELNTNDTDYEEIHNQTQQQYLIEDFVAKHLQDNMIELENRSVICTFNTKYCSNTNYSLYEIMSQEQTNIVVCQTKNNEFFGIYLSEPISNMGVTTVDPNNFIFTFDSTYTHFI